MKVQARITLPEEVRRTVDTLRMEWNPEKAVGNPAHITLVYHDEAPDVELLMERIREVTRRIGCFELFPGPARRFAAPVVGAFLAVEDPAGRVAEIRAGVLAPPFRPRERFGLHVTLLHPDQGTRLESAWPAFESLLPIGRFEVAAIDVVGPDNSVLATFPLAG